jgi:hypothetical protein
MAPYVAVNRVVLGGKLQIVKDLSVSLIYSIEMSNCTSVTANINTVNSLSYQAVCQRQYCYTCLRWLIAQIKLFLNAAKYNVHTLKNPREMTIMNED